MALFSGRPRGQGTRLERSVIILRFVEALYNIRFLQKLFQFLHAAVAIMIGLVTPIFGLCSVHKDCDQNSKFEVPIPFRVRFGTV